jgi:hypothetical protein
MKAIYPTPIYSVMKSINSPVLGAHRAALEETPATIKGSLF